MADSEARLKSGDGAKVVIKKYANRRLYNTASSSYVTLDTLSVMVREGVDFVVFDARTNEDITRSVLTQIIFEEESRGPNLLPLQFLRQLIRFYGDSMQAFVPSYLEMSLDGFAKEHDRIRSEWAGAGNAAAAGPPGTETYLTFQNQVKRNVAMFDQAMRMFSPFAYTRPEGATDEPKVATAGAPTDKPPAESQDALADMKRQLEAMQRQIADLAAKT